MDEDQTPIQKFKLDETSQDLSLSEPAAKALDKSSSNLKVSDTNKTKFKNSLQISTIDAGHNAGRSYYFQAQSADQCDEIVRSLQRLSKSARKRAEARSLFRRIQVRRQYVLLDKSRGAPVRRDAQALADPIRAAPRTTSIFMLCLIAGDGCRS